MHNRQCMVIIPAECHELCKRAVSIFEGSISVTMNVRYSPFPHHPSLGFHPRSSENRRHRQRSSTPRKERHGRPRLQVRQTRHSLSPIGHSGPGGSALRSIDATTGVDNDISTLTDSPEMLVEKLRGGPWRDASPKNVFIQKSVVQL